MLQRFPSWRPLGLSCDSKPSWEGGQPKRGGVEEKLLAEVWPPARSRWLTTPRLVTRILLYEMVWSV